MSNIEICRKPETASQESETPNVRSQEYFPFAAAWDTLAMSAQQHDREAFSTASGFLDMRPVEVLRGLAYLTENLARTPEDETDYEQSKSAMSAVAEVMSLVAVMVEHQNQSESQYLVELLAGKARAEQGVAS